MLLYAGGTPRRAIPAARLLALRRNLERKHEWTFFLYLNNVLTGHIPLGRNPFQRRRWWIAGHGIRGRHLTTNRRHRSIDHHTIFPHSEPARAGNGEFSIRHHRSARRRLTIRRLKADIAFR